MSVYMYASPIYFTLSFCMSLAFSSMECIKEKGNLSTENNAILCSWSIISLIVTFIIAAVSAEAMIKQATLTSILFAILLSSGTLVVSSLIIHWDA